MIRHYLAFCATLASSLAFGQNIVTNGSFETPDAGWWTTYGPGETFGGWLVGGAGVTHVGGFQNPPAYNGLQSVELNLLNPGSITQTLLTDVGQVYLLSFAMAGQMNAGPDIKTMDVYWDGQIIASPTWDRSVMLGQWEVHTYEVLATTSSTDLTLFGTVLFDGGPYVDDVRAVPVPEPGSILALGGLVAISALRRRRR